MTTLEKLTFAITSFAKMSPEEFELSLPYWKERSFKKGEFYNERSHICKNLGFIIDGTFRYKLDSTNYLTCSFLFPTDAQIRASLPASLKWRLAAINNLCICGKLSSYFFW